jgi:hypothetical protein
MRLGLILLALALPAKAETYLVATTVSLHLPRNGYNQWNPGLGLEHDISDRWKLAAGFYRNSIRSDSIYAGAIYTRWKLGEVRIGTSIGILTGYGRPIPMLAPMVMWGRFNFMVIPPLEGKSGVIGVQLKMPLGH